MAGDDPVGEGSLVLAVTPCAGGEVVAELAMDWRAGSERWFGLLRTRGLDAGCYAVRAIHDGVDVGGFELRLFDTAGRCREGEGRRGEGEVRRAPPAPVPPGRAQAGE